MEAETAGTGLEQELGELLDQEVFEPPRGVPRGGAGRATSRCMSEAARDPQAWWLEQTAALDWFAEPTRGARRLQPALLPVVRRRQAERLVQLPRPPRRGRQRRPGRLPLARRGGRGARGHLRRPAPRRPAARQRPARPRRRGRRRRRHLPADDPRGRRGDARLRADRRPAQRRLRRLLARRGQGADAVLRREGADHRRRRPPQGQDGRDQAGGRRLPGRGAVDRDRGRGPQHRRRGRDDRGPRPLLRRGDRGRRGRSARRPSSTPSTRCSSSTARARPRSRRGSSTRPAAT